MEFRLGTGLAKLVQVYWIKKQQPIQIEQKGIITNKIKDIRENEKDVKI